MNDQSLKDKESFHSAARAYLDQNLYQEALGLAEAWIERYPMDIDATIVCCHALVRMGKLDRVEELLGGVEEAILRLSRVYSFMGDLCLEGGLTQEAIRFYRKFISINHESEAADAVAGKLQSLVSADGSSSEAEEEPYDDISEVAPDFYTITLVDLYVRQGHLQMAADVLNEMLKKDSENIQAQDKLEKVSGLLKDKRRKEGVIQELTRWLKNIDRIRCHAS